jgi:cation diffusion facilitator CzcD-associated flavoprotein CzcO
MPVVDYAIPADTPAAGIASDGSTRAAPSATSGRDLASAWLGAFESALRSSDRSTMRDLFLADGYWRDILALTWDFRTFAGPELIADGLAEALTVRRASDFRLEARDPELFERKSRGPTVEAFFTFETEIALCRGHFRLLLAGDTWKAWTLVTSMEDIKGHEEQAGPRRPRGSEGHDAAGAGHSNPATRAGSASSDRADPQVLVVGAGQAGLAVAARLAQLDIDALVIDREARVGDNWRNRYQSLLLHNQIWANHLPYLQFPAAWPMYLSKEHMATWLEAYASVLGLTVWTSTNLVRGDFDRDTQRWTVLLDRPDGTVATLHPRHIVQATGVFGIANRPEIAGADQFDGLLIHASDYHGKIAAEGRRVLVVGTGSSGHDVAQDLCNAGAHVTMLQRSSTCVVSVEPGAARAYSIYSESGPPIEDADLVTNSFPFPLVAELHKELTRRIAEMDRDLLQGLRDAGFAVDFGEDGSGFLMKYHRYGGGYYINVGCSDLIVAGKIKIKQGVEIERLTGKTVAFTDGTSMVVDIVVVAAGYKNMSESVRALLGSEVADRVGPVWGLDLEGEVRGMWRRTGQPGFWLMGGSLQQCRPYSKYLALQIKGTELGLI